MATPNPSTPIRRSTSHPEKPARSTSPYYHGLTDSTLYVRSLGVSPGRDSFASSSTKSSSSLSSSSIFVLFQDWVPSCFSKIGKKKHDDEEEEEVNDGYFMPKAEPVQQLPRGGIRKPLRESDATAAVAAAGAAVVAKHVVMEKEREYVWAYNYRPMFLKEFICHRDQVAELQEMVRKQQSSHFMFEGPTGVGKTTMVLAFLRDALGVEKLKTRKEMRKIELKEEHIASIEVNVKISSYHVEINLSELRGYEKHVIVSLINESHGPSTGNTMHCDHSNSRVIVVHEADKLSTDAQYYIRWIMEKYKGCNKIFFCCYDSSKLQTIKHLCKIVKLQQPSHSEIVGVLEFIAKKEQVELPHHLAEQIAKNSKNNLRQAIRSFEASWKSKHSLKDEQDILTGWEEVISNIAKSIVKEQSPKQLYIIRGKLKLLIEHYVSPDFIFNNLILELKKLLDDQYHGKIDAMYQEYKIFDSGPILNPERSLVSFLGGQEDSGAKFNDQRKNIQYFMKIEDLLSPRALYRTVRAKVEKFYLNVSQFNSSS